MCLHMLAVVGSSTHRPSRPQEAFHRLWGGPAFRTSNQPSAISSRILESHRLRDLQAARRRGLGLSASCFLLSAFGFRVLGGDGGTGPGAPGSSAHPRRGGFIRPIQDASAPLQCDRSRVSPARRVHRVDERRRHDARSACFRLSAFGFVLSASGFRLPTSDFVRARSARRVALP
jgi:hypothetical protein